MRFGLLLAGMAAATIAAPGASAGCSLNFPQAVACFDPANAAGAFQAVGRDPHALDKDYVRATLERAKCVSFASVADPGEAIQKAASGRIPSMTGWTPVLFVVVRNKQYGGTAIWIAADYISGECEKMPTVQ